MDHITLDIVLATYNGERFLPQQINSILSQDYPHWQLLARDDGSTDGSLSILRSYAERYPEKIYVLNDTLGNLGILGNFSRLLEHSNADYTALCDQDDVWLPDKLSRSLEAIRNLEATYGEEMPGLVFTDLVVADENLNSISSSFWSYRGIDPAGMENFARLLIRSVVTGCTAMLNRSLRELATPIAPRAAIHDWWIALCAAAFGKSTAITEPTVLYRKHGANAIGVSHRLVQIYFAATHLNRVRQELAQSFTQANAFYQKFKSILSEEHKNELDQILKLPSKDLFSRYNDLARLGIAQRHSLHLAAFTLLIPRGR